MELKESLPYSQEPTTGPYSESYNSSALSHILVL
jgi:hypothetical protein